MEKIWEARRESCELQPNDVRTEWERDYARLIHSAAFRRLQCKTQVLGLGESDFYRTRLTHSMEVAQIGSGINRWLKKHHENDLEISENLPDDALINSICLAHDIGHPPFGHGGEIALNICMRNYGGFEGNGQTLRILSRLENYTLEHGLNPTRRLLLGVLKYPASYKNVVVDEYYGELCSPKWLSKSDRQHPPKCYMDSELDIVDWILEPLTQLERVSFIQTEEKHNGATRKHNKPIHKALDTSIMELADDISYSLHDLEDAISLGMISIEDWNNHNINKKEIFQEYQFNSPNLDKNLFSQDSHLRKKEIGKLVHNFITHTKIEKSEIDDASCSLIKWNANIEKPHRILLDHIFDLVKNKVIKSSNVQQLEFKGQKLVVELFDALHADPERLLPERTSKKYRSEEDPDQQARIICDYIAGMTDEYATKLYEKLYYPHKGSIFDRL